jgi:hypothetical protein
MQDSRACLMGERVEDPAIGNLNSLPLKRLSPQAQVHIVIIVIGDRSLAERA